MVLEVVFCGIDAVHIVLLVCGGSAVVIDVVVRQRAKTDEGSLTFVVKKVQDVMLYALKIGNRDVVVAVNQSIFFADGEIGDVSDDHGGLSELEMIGGVDPLVEYSGVRLLLAKKRSDCAPANEKATLGELLQESGVQRGNRTHDLSLRRGVLYPLSYPDVFGGSGRDSNSRPTD